MTEKDKIVLATLIGMGLTFLTAVLAMFSPWVVDGLTGDTRISSRYVWVLAPQIIGVLVLWFTFIIYLEWSNRQKLSTNELRAKAQQRLILGVLAIGILVGSIMTIPYVSSMMDIGGPELPDEDNWKTVIFFWGVLLVFSTSCVISAVWTTIERYNRMRVVG